MYIPIPKSNSKNGPSGYRPIICKMLEKLIHALICDNLAEHAPIYSLTYEKTTNKRCHCEKGHVD